MTPLLMPKRLLIVAEAFRRSAKYPYPIPAWKRYAQGVCFRSLAKLERQGKLDGIDILIVTSRFGIIEPEEEIPYHRPEPKLVVATEAAAKLRASNLKRLKRLLEREQYFEIFCNLGYEYYKSIEGFEKFTKAVVIRPSSSGFGRRTRDMINWICRCK